MGASRGSFEVAMEVPRLMLQVGPDIEDDMVDAGEAVAGFMECVGTRFIFSNFLFIFFIYFAKLYNILKFIRFDHQPPWRTATAMGHDGWRSNLRPF
jgi:hypothetical protein